MTDAWSIYNQAELYRNQEKYEEALPLYQQALAILEITLGNDHPDMAAILNNMALVYRHQCKYDEALSLHNRSLAITRTSLEPLFITNLDNIYPQAWLLFGLQGIIGGIFLGATLGFLDNRYNGNKSEYDAF